MVLKVYGIVGSQPYRTVEWLLLQHGLPFEFIYVQTGSENGTRSPAFLQNVNPAGTLPVIDDEGYILWESHAILIYLCEKHGWTDVYPEDPNARGLINQWLNWHHQNTRRFSLALFAPVLRPDIKISEKALSDYKQQLQVTAGIIEDQLDKTKFLTGDNVTLADMATYGEIGQFTEDYCGGFDFGPFPNIERWIGEMKKVTKYDEAHRAMPNIAKVFRDAQAKI